MTIDVHSNAISSAQNTLKNIKEGTTDVQAQTVLIDFRLSKANDVYNEAKSARQFAYDNNYPSMYWPEDENGLVKTWNSYPDGKTDIITDSDKYGAFEATTVTYSSKYDTTPNSIKVEYYRPSTEYTYDEHGNCTKIVESSDDKVQSAESFAYNDANQIIYHEFDEDNDGVIDEREYFEYCHEGLHIAQVIDESGSFITRTKYNCEDGAKTSVEYFDEYLNEYNHKTEYQYDECSKRLKSMTSTSDYEHDYYEFNYDENGNLESVDYENKFVKTFKGFLLNIFGDFGKDTTIQVQ